MAVMYRYYRPRSSLLASPEMSQHSAQIRVELIIEMLAGDICGAIYKGSSQKLWYHTEWLKPDAMVPYRTAQARDWCHT